MLNLLNKTKWVLVPTVRGLSSSVGLRTASEEIVQDVKEAAKPPPSSAPALLIPQTFKEFSPLNLKDCRQAWIENLDTAEERKLGLMELHPDVFATQPRVDIIQENIEWQRKYRYVSFAHSKSRAEARGGGRKPWPQKGGGRSRHGSLRSPMLKGGGVAHGPRSPTTHFYMLPFFKRVLGLTSTLSVKLAQNDLHIIRDVEIPSKDPEFIRDLIKERNWGPSVLIVDKDDIFPENICYATDSLGYVNLMPAFSLNCYSMLKHDTLVLTVEAAKHIEDRLLFQIHRTDAFAKEEKFKLDQV